MDKYVAAKEQKICLALVFTVTMNTVELKHRN